MIETGVFFGNIHSFHDLNLVLSAVSISPATPKTTYVDVPGSDGALDLTEAHGDVKYGNRVHTFTFTVHPSETKTFDEKVTEIANALNGRHFDNITLDRDPGYYWQGRCSVKEYKQNKRIKQIVVTATVKPYKLKKDITVFRQALTAEATPIILTNGRKTVVPTIECTEENTVVVFGDISQTLGVGTFKVLDIGLVEGDNVLTVSGSGTITFKYQEGEL